MRILSRARVISLLHPPQLSQIVSSAPYRFFPFRSIESTLATMADSTSPQEATCPAAAAGVVPEGYAVVQEGKGRILHLQDSNDVFYNKAQVVNRDLSVNVLRLFQEIRSEEAAAGTLKRHRARNKGPHPAVAAYPDLAKKLGLVPPPPSEEPQSQQAGEADDPKEGACESSEAPAPEPPALEPPALEPPAPLRILEGLAASGLRAMRYALEVPDVGTVVASDMDPVAVEAIRRNVQFNLLADKVVPLEADARLLMLQMDKAFDAVDLDPYGTPSTFLDSAVQTVADGGVMCVTATDMAVLCGNNKEVCWMKYGSFPLRAKYCHEMALRILLANIESHANRHKRHIVPLLSVSVDFYIRVFVRVFTSAGECKFSPTKLSYVFQCVGCEGFHWQPLARTCSSKDGQTTRFMPAVAPTVSGKCEQCGWDFNMGGPFWNRPIHDAEFAKRLLSNLERDKDQFKAYGKVHALLTAIGEELTDVPLFMTLHQMTSVLKCTPPPGNLFRSAIINAGYRASGAHSNPLATKTDAPMSVLWDILRCWIQEHPVKPSKEKTPGAAILAKEPTIKANFSRVYQAMSQAQLKGVSRFPENPEANWGPMARAGTNSKRSLPQEEGQQGSGESGKTKMAKVE